MITPFGKLCRKIRIDHDENMKDMADKLNVTPSYLSAIEKGKRKIPSYWVDIIFKNYKLKEDQVQELIQLITIGQLTEREVKVLSEVVQVIYFQDRSDYIRALWEVLRILLGDEAVNNEGFNINQLVRTMNAYT